jgi:hypothetical protein
MLHLWAKLLTDWLRADEARNVEPAWTKREYDQSNPPQPRKAYAESIPLLSATKSFRAMVPPRRFPHRHLYASDTRWEVSSEEARRAPSLGSSGGSALPVASGAASSPRCPGAPARTWSSVRPDEHLVIRSGRRARLVQRLHIDLQFHRTLIRRIVKPSNSIEL